jgi:hypothetical protein
VTGTRATLFSAIIRLNDDLVRLERCKDYTVSFDEANFRKGAGKRPSLLQYFIASIGFCMSASWRASQQN